MNKKINPCGESMRELSMEELENIYGADSATPMSGVICSISKTVASISKSSKKCIAASISAIGGIISYNKECLG